MIKVFTNSMKDEDLETWLSGMFEEGFALIHVTVLPRFDKDGFAISRYFFQRI